jgi:hypothetical protein
MYWLVIPSLQSYYMILYLTSIVRNNAEEALQKLNGTVIGKQTVRLSWGRNPGHKQVLILPPFLSTATLLHIFLSLPYRIGCV